MGDSISPADARAYLGRWPDLRKREADLARGEPVEVRLRQLSALFDSRHLFAADPLREAEDEALRRRWQQLRETLGGA